jgi:predicted polyphosphate/ATP-dependent NAD kinase
VGLIVNPLAGVGGRYALKGSDDRALVDAALARGATAPAPARAVAALEAIGATVSDLELLTYPGAMGEDEARAAGFVPILLGQVSGPTTAADTTSAACALADAGVELLLVVGGDGTAVDVHDAIGDRVPVIGIPAGVKMHSAVFAVNPRSGGRLVALFLQGRSGEIREAEVMDIDEDALRQGVVSPRLHGYLNVPSDPALVQRGKARSAPAERLAQQAIASYVAENVLGSATCFVGPGTTTKALMDQLGLPKTVLGVDIVCEEGLVAADADEEALLEIADADTLVIVTPIGGQGFLFGRGNQQLSGRVLRRVGRDRIVVVATDAKLAALERRPLLVDTGEPDVDEMLRGYLRVITGYDRMVVYPVSDGSWAG